MTAMSMRSANLSELPPFGLERPLTAVRPGFDPCRPRADEAGDPL
jgi:hypothetical protein